MSVKHTTQTPLLTKLMHQIMYPSIVLHHVMTNRQESLEQTRKAYNGRESYLRITEAELKCIHRNCTYIAIYGQVKTTTQSTEKPTGSPHLTLQCK